MNTKKYQFGFGEGAMELDLPTDRILYDIKGTAAEAIADVPAAVREALRNPIGTLPLAQTVKAGDKVVVQNVHIIKRHTKANPQSGQAGGIIEREAPIHVSNVMLLNPVSGKGEKVGFKVLEDGRKLRVFRSSGEAIDA